MSPARRASLLLSFAALSAGAAILPFASSIPSDGTSYDSILVRTWEGIKKRNIDAYAIPLVHRAKSEAPHDAVSEGVGYGLLLSVYCDDQTYFDKIWDAAERWMWADGFYNWRVDRDGKSSGLYWTGPASDAEQDIALALIFADKLVERRHWNPHTSPRNVTYRQRAQIMLETLWTIMVEDGRYLKPGNWGGKGALNPGYFAPAFYRVFDAFDGASGRNWTVLIDQCYNTLAATPGASKGLVPDWCTHDGRLLSEGPGYNAYDNGQTMYKDGIRAYWRLATDYAWYKEPRAKAFLEKALAFAGSADRANFYTMSGNRATGTFTLENGLSRPRAEHSHLTAGMWAAAAMGTADAVAARVFGDELRRFYDGGSADYWGNAVDPAGEDTAHNEMYFDQFLAWFGAALAGGVFTNLWTDLQDPDPLTPLAWKVVPAVQPLVIDASVEPLRIGGVLNKAVPWSVSLKSMSATALGIASATNDTVSCAWYGIDGSGRAMPAGEYEVTVSAAHLAPVIRRVWLGRAIDLRGARGRVLVDDVRDMDTKPFIGAWTSYLDSHDGKAGKSSVDLFCAVQSGAGKYLEWRAALDQGGLGFQPYAALEWRLPESTSVAGLDGVSMYAGSTGALGISVQLVSRDISDFNYFEDSTYLSSRLQRFDLPLTGFKQRWGGTRQIDASKISAIRFQVQKPSGTLCTIHLSELSLAGSLERLYVSPPPFVAPDNSFSAVRSGLRPRASMRGIVGWFDLQGKMVGSGSAQLHLRNAPGAGLSIERDRAGAARVVLMP